MLDSLDGCREKLKENRNTLVIGAQYSRLPVKD